MKTFKNETSEALCCVKRSVRESTIKCEIFHETGNFDGVHFEFSFRSDERGGSGGGPEPVWSDQIPPGPSLPPSPQRQSSYLGWLAIWYSWTLSSLQWPGVKPPSSNQSESEARGKTLKWGTSGESTLKWGTSGESDIQGEGWRR